MIVNITETIPHRAYLQQTDLEAILESQVEQQAQANQADDSLCLKEM